jgi:1-acyl-sn-glycerol-3-phosphate acyltransferase
MAKAAVNPISRPVPLDGAWPAVPRIAGAAWIAWRLTTFTLWTLLCAPVQAVLLVLPGRAKTRLPMLYWAGVCWCLALRVRVIGELGSGALPTVFVSNHSSWMDIPALGSCLPACFIAKDEVGRWPVISMIARLGRTVFVSRRATGAVRENADIARRLRDGDSLILFPEGTTSDGARVMPFRSAFLAVAESNQPHILQPVSIVYDELDFLPVRRADRALLAWFGDMDLASHFARLGRHRGLRVTIELHPPVDTAAGLSRKQLATTVWRQVAMSATEIRRNRIAPRKH